MNFYETFGPLGSGGKLALSVAVRTLIGSALSD